MIAILGTVGLGLVWGWLAGLVIGRSGRPWHDAIFLSLATASLGGTVYLFADWQPILFFAGAALFTFLAHLAWLNELRRRFD